MKKRESRSRAFSLVELMVVMAIIAILVGLAIPAFNSIGKASALTNSGYLVEDQLKLARQMAVAQNRKVAVRFYNTEGDIGKDKEYCALRVYISNETAEKPIAAGALKKLPSGIVMSSDPKFSTLLNNGFEGMEDLPGAPGVKYRQVEFGPTGGTSLDMNGAGGDKWFLTLKAENDKGDTTSPAKNFITVMIDPVNGRTKTFQP